MSKKSPKTGRDLLVERLRARQRPLLSLPQVLILASIIIGVYVGFDLNRRAHAGALIDMQEEVLMEKVDLEATRYVELIMTREYVNSDAYVEDYARDEAGQSQPGEIRVVPLMIKATPIATPVPTATPDPAYDARPWQAWWRLLSDAPLPSG
jgi:hypothetical protein